MHVHGEPFRMRHSHKNYRACSIFQQKQDLLFLLLYKNEGFPTTIFPLLLMKKKAKKPLVKCNRKQTLFLSQPMLIRISRCVLMNIYLWARLWVFLNATSKPGSHHPSLFSEWLVKLLSYGYYRLPQIVRLTEH